MKLYQMLMDFMDVFSNSEFLPSSFKLEIYKVLEDNFSKPEKEKWQPLLAGLYAICEIKSIKEIGGEKN